MAVNDDSSPQIIRRLSTRERNWLANMFMYHPVDVGAPGFFRSGLENNKERIIARAVMGVTDPSRLEQRINQLMEERLVNESKIKWINQKDQRVLIWVYARMHEKLQIEGVRSMPHPGSVQPAQRYSEILLALDIWAIDADEKVREVDLWKAEWTGQMLPPSKTRWIDLRNEVQVDWIYNYLANHGVSANAPTPVNHQEKGDCILAALDHTSKRAPDSQELFLTKLRKSWAQYKYRHTGDAMRQVYMPLSLRTKEMLDALAEHDGRPKYRVVEDLIKLAHSNLESRKNI